MTAIQTNAAVCPDVFTHPMLIFFSLSFSDSIGCFLRSSGVTAGQQSQIEASRCFIKTERERIKMTV